MTIARVGWAVPLAVAAIVAGTPGLRDQARLQWAMAPRRGVVRSSDPGVVGRDPIAEWMVGYGRGSLEFAQRRHRGDPDMLIAAAALAPDRDSAREVLADLVLRDGRPVTWAAYVDSLLETCPWYFREETAGVDPDSAREMAKVRRIIVERKLPTSLEGEDIAPALEAARRWQEAEPDNALPLAVEAWGLYGLHRDGEAFDRWAAASHLPRVSAWVSERRRGVSRLLGSMGMAAPEATLASRPAIRACSLERVAVSAFAATFAGHCAQTAGDPEQALRCWQASMDLGRHAQESAETVRSFLVGVEVEKIGAAPVWRWESDAVTGLRTRGGAGGRFFFGPHHDLYARKAGRAADGRLVEGLAAAEKRTRMVGAFSAQGRMMAHYARAAEFLVFGQLVGGFGLGAAALLLVAVVLLRRGGAAGGLPARWQLALGLVGVVAVACAAGIVLAVAPMFPFTPLPAPTGRQLAAGIGAPLLLLVGLSLGAAALYRRNEGLSRGVTGSLRGVLAFTVVLSSVLYLVLGVAAMDLRARWHRQWERPGVTEMHLITRRLGRMWGAPRVPPDAWSAQEPPRPGG